MTFRGHLKGLYSYVFGKVERCLKINAVVKYSLNVMLRDFIKKLAILVCKQ